MTYQGRYLRTPARLDALLHEGGALPVLLPVAYAEEALGRGKLAYLWLTPDEQFSNE